MSSFDAATFLDVQILEPSLKRPPLPAGRDFVGTIGEPKSRTWQSKDGSKSGVAIDVPIEIDLTSAQPPLGPDYAGIDRVVINDSVMLDVTPAGGIDNSPGKNVKLRRYREALNMNQAGQPFSFRAMQGRPIRVKISHREYQGDFFDQIDSVAKA